MGSLRGPFVLTVLQFLTAGVILVVVGAVLGPETKNRRLLLAGSVAVAVLVVTHTYRRMRDDTWPALTPGRSVAEAVGIDDADATGEGPIDGGVPDPDDDAPGESGGNAHGTTDAPDEDGVSVHSSTDADAAGDDGGAEAGVADRGRNRDSQGDR